MGVWEARMAREEGERGRASPPFSLARGLVRKFTSLPFRTLARRL